MIPDRPNGPNEKRDENQEVDYPTTKEVTESKVGYGKSEGNA